MTGGSGARESDGLPWLITDPTVAATVATGLLLPAVLGMMEFPAASSPPSADRGRAPHTA